jgi:hypothetical protein
MRELLRSPLGAHEAFIAAYDRLSGLARVARRPAVLAAAVDDRARVVEAVLVESGDVSLRQLVLYAQAESPDTAPVSARA